MSYHAGMKWTPATLGLLSALMAGCGSEGDRAGPPEAGVGPLPDLQPASAAAVLERVERPGARAVLVNVWATWCAPCREEFPDLVRLHRAYRDRGLRLVLVSADFEDRAFEARRFLARQGVDFPSFLKTGDDMSFIDGIEPRWTGALPATFVYDGRATLRLFREGRMSYADFERAVLAAMRATDSLATQEVPP